MKLNLTRKRQNFLGLETSAQEADVILIPVPWDVTASIKPGTSKAPEKIIEASEEVELFIPNLKTPIIYMEKIDKAIIASNRELRYKAEEVMEHNYENPKQEYYDVPNEIKTYIDEINEASERLNKSIYDYTKSCLELGKITGVIGGEHSIIEGHVRAIVEKHPGVSILQIDAHCDLKPTYDHFTCSHASVMYNLSYLFGHQISKLVQIGIRELDKDEFEMTNTSKRICTFTDEYLSSKEFNGYNWDDICNKQILPELSLNNKVYISLDLDGLEPQYSPNTGTITPGGLSYQKIVYLFKKIVFSGKEIVGFDIVETGNNIWDANVAAKLTLLLSALSVSSKNKI